MKKRLTKRTVDALPTPEGAARVTVRDTDLRGFGCVKFPSGVVTFIVEWGPRGSQRRMAIGQHGPLTVEQAREQARKLLGDVAHGVDPLGEREARRAASTFSEWVDEYLADVARRKKSAGDDRRFLSWAAARWGARPLVELTTLDVTRAFEERRADHGKVSANRFLASVRACLQAAWRVEKVSENVAARVRLLPENQPRQRVLSDEELGRVLAGLDEVADPFTRAAFELLLSTGARKSEVLGARWEDMDLDSGTWHLPSPKAGHPQVVPLPRTAVAMLCNLPRLGPWVVPGRDPACRRDDLRRAWRALRERAEVQGVTIHDLRRTYGLHVARAAGLHVASKLLRHSTVRITERVYAPLGLDELRKATEKVAKGRGKVLQLRRRGEKR
jgi:integrase